MFTIIMMKLYEDHSPPSSAKVKNAWSHTSTPLIRLHGVVLSLKKERGQLYLHSNAYDRHQGYI